MRHLFSAAVLFLASTLFAGPASADAGTPRGPQLKTAKSHVSALYHAPAGAHKAKSAKPRLLARSKAKPTAALAKPAAPLMVEVKGVVLGPNSLALPGAVVFPVGKLGQMVVTNEDGEFSFTMPAAAARGLQLRATYAGLGEWQVRVANGHEALFITLMPVEKQQM